MSNVVRFPIEGARIPQRYFDMESPMEAHAISAALDYVLMDFFEDYWKANKKASFTDNMDVLNNYKSRILDLCDR